MTHMRCNLVDRGQQMDMKGTNKSRVQRRVEKKQVTLLTGLVVVIALASFALGVLVGRNTVEPEIVQQVIEPQRIVVAEDPAEKVETPAPLPPAEEKLTFYDNLSKDNPAPIGSGINLPPESEKQPEANETETPAAEEGADVVAAVKADVPPPAPTPLSSPVPPPPASPAPKTSAGMPKVVKGGDWVVQLFSSQSAADAGILRDKLNAKGYPAYIAEADLGTKGIWYRVLLGPYADKEAAVQAQNYAAQKDKLKGFAKHK